MDSNNRNALFAGIASAPREAVKNDTKDTVKHSAPQKPRITKDRQAKEQPATKSKRKTSLYLSPEKLKELKILCAEMEVSMTIFIEEAIDSKMKSEFRKRGKEAESHGAIES